MKKNLLYITFHRLSDNNGGCNASKGFMRCFAALYDNCSIIYPHFEGDTDAYIPSSFLLYPMYDKRTKVKKLFDMYRGVTSGLYYHVREHLKTHKYHTIVIDHSFTGTGLCKYLRTTGAYIITIHHNVERDYLRDNGNERPLFYRYPFLYYSKRAERQCLQYSHLNLTVTNRDAETFRSWYPEQNIQHWGIFEYKKIENKTFTPKENRMTFIITGSLYFRQSLVPIVDFIQYYWPLVIAIHPESTLLIAGRKPSQELINLCGDNRNIKIIANPEDMAVVVSKANYYICPIYTGSGLKLRNWDGLKQGLPILCHERSAAGYEVFEKRKYLFSYHDDKTFIESLNRLLSNKIAPEDIYAAYREVFSLDTGIKKLHDILVYEHII